MGLYIFVSVWNKTFSVWNKKLYSVWNKKNPKYSRYTKSENTTRKKTPKLLSIVHSSEATTMNMWENAFLDLFHILE